MRIKTNLNNAFVHLLLQHQECYSNSFEDGKMKTENMNIIIYGSQTSRSKYEYLYEFYMLYHVFVLFLFLFLSFNKKNRESWSCKWELVRKSSK